MSLGSRIATRGKAAIVASLTSTPREPLLFLYPQWTRDLSTTAVQHTPVRDGRRLTTCQRSYANSAIRSSNLIAEALVDSTHTTHPTRNDRDASSDQKVDVQKHGERTATQEPASRAVRDFRVKTTIPKPGEKLHAQEALKKTINKTNRIQRIAEENARLDRRIRKVYQETRREGRESWIPDWRVILGDLRKRTPSHPKWFEKAVSISVPESAAEKLLNGVDDNMWDIAERYDCSVALGKPDTVTGQHIEFIISGSHMAISKTAAAAMQIAPGSRLEKNRLEAQMLANFDFSTTKSTIDSANDLSCSPTLRFVRTEVSSTMRATRVEEIPRPSEWTITSFADYVDQLTSMRMPNHKHHLLYKKGEEHVKIVSKTLRELFTDPKCRYSLSRTAFKRALEYFVKSSSIADARATFVVMDMMGIQMDQETFNILLRGAAKNEDLHNYHFILHLMLRRGILPNGGTWIAFLMANHDSRIKRYIVAEMKAKGLLAHPAVLRRMCQELVVREANTSMDLGQSQDEFLEHMDARYGKDWLTVDNGNRVLHAFGARNLISRCWEFLRAMNARFVKIDHVSVDTILNHCKQQQNAAGAIEIMKLLPSFGAYTPDQFTYHALFEIAWRKRSYNLAKVVWKYACLDGATTARMRKLVASSLINATATPDPETPQTKRWRQQAGFVITNDVFEHPTLWARNPRDKKNEGSSDEMSNEHAPGLKIRQTVSREEMVQAVKRHLECDYKLFKSWKPAQPFGDVLMKAWELDHEWQRERMRTEGGEQLDWKVRDAVSVPIVSHRGAGRQAIPLEWR